MSEVRTHPRIPAVQRTVPMCAAPAADLSDGGNRVPSEPCAPEHVLSGFPPGVL